MDKYDGILCINQIASTLSYKLICQLAKQAVNVISQKVCNELP